MFRMDYFSTSFVLALMASTAQVASADAAVQFSDLTKAINPVKQAATTISGLQEMTTTSTRGCLGYDAARLHERAQPFHDTIMTYANRYGVDHNLIKAVIAIESCYNISALSPKSAQGLMQLIPATASRFGVTDASDSSQNIRGGTRYLAWLIERFNGDVSKALAGYNAGEGAVDKYAGIPPYRETRNYVINVLAVYQRLSNRATPTVIASPTLALQEDLGGISSELTQVLRSGATTKLPTDETLVTASSGEAPNLSDTGNSATAIANANPTSTSITPPVQARSQPQQRPSAVRTPPVVTTYATASRPNNQPRMIRVSANARMTPQRLDAGSELAARVIDGLTIGGPPISYHHEPIVATKPAKPPIKQATNPVRPAATIAKQNSNQTRPVTMPNTAIAKQPVQNTNAGASGARQQVAIVTPQPRPTSNPPAQGRITHTYLTALSKPGRGGFEANRARAPGLYKLQ